MIIRLYLIGFYLLCTIQSSTCDICSTCSCSNLEINCHGKYSGNSNKLTFDLLTLDNYSMKKLVLSKNHLINLPINVFKKISHLKSLDLSENIMDKIYTIMFIDLKNLEDLNLSNNTLKTFDNSLLEVLPTLLTLNLSYNYIDSIEYLMDKTVSKMNMLDLSHNIISSLPKRFSESLPELQYLDLSFNRIHSLHDCSLIHLNSLKVFYLNNNMLTTLNMQILPKMLTELHSGYNEISEILYSLHHIEVLNIEHNKIHEIHENLTTNSLQYFNVRGNMLSSFPNILFENLKVLDISSNKLTYIPEVISVENFPLLVQLNVSKNPIQNLTIYSDLKLNSFIASNMIMLKSIDKDTLANLKPSKDCINLTISDNKMLSFIDEDALEHMNLCSLDLSNNHLSYVAQKLILHNNTSTILSINLQGNPFKCNCALQWILDKLISKLYSIQPNLLDDLRCAWPPEISNTRMVHWYGWKDQIFCTNHSNFNENLTMNVSNSMIIETITINSDPGFLSVIAIATTVLTILVIVGIVWTQRIIMKRRRINRIF